MNESFDPILDRLKELQAALGHFEAEFARLFDSICSGEKPDCDQELAVVKAQLRLAAEQITRLQLAKGDRASTGRTVVIPAHHGTSYRPAQTVSETSYELIKDFPINSHDRIEFVVALYLLDCLGETFHRKELATLLNYDPKSIRTVNFDKKKCRIRDYLKERGIELSGNLFDTGPGVSARRI